MPGVNDFKQFANSGGANVITQAAYAGLAILPTGFVAGTAQSEQLNKVWRQSAAMSAMIGQAIADLTGTDALDNGNIVVLQARFIAMLQSAVAQSGVAFGDGTGSANAVVVTVTPAPTALTNGLAVLVKVAVNNTGPSTINVNGLGIKNIRNADGTPLLAGQMSAAGYALFTYDGTQFQMLSMPGPAFFTSLLASASYTAVDTGAANALVANLSVPPSSLGSVLYIPLSIKVAANNTGAATLNLNSLGAVPIVNPDGSVMVAGQLVASMMLFIYNGTSFVLASPSGPRVHQTGRISYAVAGGTANALTLTLAPVPLSLIAGMPVRFQAIAANTTASTINVNGLGVVSIRNSAGAVLTGGEIIVNGLYEILYDGALFRMVSTPSNLAGGGRQTGVTVFASGSGNYTPAAGVSKIQVEIVGGGGGGGGGGATGGSTVAVGGGGGSGGYAFVEFLVSALSPPLAYAVGVGGVGNSGASGSAGAASTFGTAGALITAPGGSGGSTSGVVSNATTRVATGGAPAGISTQAGGVWSRLSGGSPGQAGTTSDDSGSYVTAGGGASGPWGGGGAPATPGAGVWAGGGAASGPGAGGGGAVVQPSGAAQIGGAGRAGEIVIREFS